MRLGFDGVNGTRLWTVHRNAIWLGLAGIPILGFWYVYGPWEYPLVGNIGTVLIATGMLLGSSWGWIQYLAERQRFYWNHTIIGNARFKCTITNKGLFCLYVGNFFLMLGSLGLARPWVKVRTIKYELENLQLVGEVDFALIFQEASDASGTGDELSGLLDLEGVGG